MKGILIALRNSSVLFFPQIMSMMLIFGIIASNSSCKKADTATEASLGNAGTVEQKFFSEYRTANSTEKALVEYLQRINAKNPFVKETVEKIGYPRWDKTITKAKQPILQMGRNGTDSVQTFYVPFVRESQEYVNAAMIIKASATDTSFGYRCDWQYREMQNSDERVSDSAEYFATFFMSLDKAVFGHRRFKITDTTLFRNNHHNAAFIVLDSTNNTAGGNNLIEQVTHCEDVLLYVKDCEYEPDCEGPGGTCDLCYLCISTMTYRYCWSEFVDIGGSGGGTGNPGGGGGTGGGGTPPDCGEPQGVVAGRGNEPCEEVPGWEPIEDDPPSIYEVLDAKLNLSDAEYLWLHNNPLYAETITNFLTNAEGNENPLTNMPYYPSEDPRALMAAKATLQTAMAGILETGYNSSHFNILVSNLPPPANATSMDPMMAVWFSITCINMKIEHPEWSNARVYLEASLEVVHILLDGAGMVPVIGEIADLTNGIIYTIQGDGVNATLSFAATIPIAGWAATATKYARKTIIALDGTKRTLSWTKNTIGTITFGDRGLLRKALGLAKGDARKAHHLIPWMHSSKEIVQKAAQADFHLNEILNGIPLTSVQHIGSHAIYNSKVATRLTNLENQAIINNWNNQQCANAVRNLANEIRNWIVTHPNESIDNIVL